ncbi:MAG: hypothetical protein QOH99_572 [Frankiaceae bacterium]|nr:hypothetical protein [Frankiaceae bacterium]
MRVPRVPPIAMRLALVAERLAFASRVATAANSYAIPNCTAAPRPAAQTSFAFVFT